MNTIEIRPTPPEGLPALDQELSPLDLIMEPVFGSAEPQPQPELFARIKSVTTYTRAYLGALGLERTAIIDRLDPEDFEHFFEETTVRAADPRRVLVDILLGD